MRRQTELQPCGHHMSALVCSDEGTCYCRACEDEARAIEQVKEMVRKASDALEVVHEDECQSDGDEPCGCELALILARMYALLMSDSKNVDGLISQAAGVLDDLRDYNENRVFSGFEENDGVVGDAYSEFRCDFLDFLANKHKLE